MIWAKINILFTIFQEEAKDVKNLEELAELQAKQKEIIKKEAEGIKEPEVPLHKGVTYKTYSTAVLKSNKKFKVYMTCFIFILQHWRMSFAIFPSCSSLRRKIKWQSITYRLRAITSRSWLETALEY